MRKGLKGLAFVEKKMVFSFGIAGAITRIGKDRHLYICGGFLKIKSQMSDVVDRNN